MFVNFKHKNQKFVCAAEIKISDEFLLFSNSKTEKKPPQFRLKNATFFSKIFQFFFGKKPFKSDFLQISKFLRNILEEKENFCKKMLRKNCI